MARTTDILRQEKKVLELRLVKAALAEAGGNIEAAAKALGKHGSVLHRIIKRLDLSDYVAECRYKAATGQRPGEV